MKTFSAIALGICFGIVLSTFTPKRFNPSAILTRPPSPAPTNVPQLPRITTPQTIRAFVTAYDPYDEECVGQYAHDWPRKTATGADAERPGAAADLAVIPAGTTVTLPGIGTFTIDDDGGAMRHAARKPEGPFYWIDIRIPAPYGIFPDPAYARKEAHAIAKQQGARWMEIHVAPPGGP